MFHRDSRPVTLDRRYKATTSRRRCTDDSYRYPLPSVRANKRAGKLNIHGHDDDGDSGNVQLPCAHAVFPGPSVEVEDARDRYLDVTAAGLQITVRFTVAPY
ncbi:hypothetical protein CBL_05852 [Carabus blaptoides fortunei]